MQTTKRLVDEIIDDIRAEEPDAEFILRPKVLLIEHLTRPFSNDDAEDAGDDSVDRPSPTAIYSLNVRIGDVEVVNMC